MIRLAVDNTPALPVAAERRAKLAKVHIARKSLGLGEDDYRAMLERVTGRRSAKDCDDRQLGDVLGEFARLGGKPVGATIRRAPAGGAVARKARAMWISLYQLAAIEDGSESALEAFARRQLGVDRLQWADERQGFKLIEALKSIADRHGWDQRVSTRLPLAERIRILKDRLVGAQLGALTRAGVGIEGPLAADRRDWSNRRLESAAAELASCIREMNARRIAPVPNAPDAPT